MIKDVGALLIKVENEIRKQTDIATIGLSGGADSTLVATLCVEALGKENVYGLHMPYNEIDMKSFNSRSQNFAERLGINHERILIRGAVDNMASEFRCIFKCMPSQLNLGNMRSRMRMVALYTYNCSIAERRFDKRCRVVGTGNLSEDYIGYDTKGGDALCDFFPIGSLFKSEVYQLLDYFIANGTLTEDLVDRVPSAGLWDGQTDEGELGHTYNEMEPSILKCLSGTQDLTDPIDKFVFNRHASNKHKHEVPPNIDLSEFREIK